MAYSSPPTAVSSATSFLFSASVSDATVATSDGAAAASIASSIVAQVRVQKARKAVPYYVITTRGFIKLMHARTLGQWLLRT